MVASGQSHENRAVSECDEMELAVILMPVLPMGPSRPWRSLGGMLAKTRAWSAAEVMPAKDTPRIVSRQGSPCSLCVSMAPVTIAVESRSWGRRIVSSTLLAPRGKALKRSQLLVVLIIGML